MLRLRRVSLDGEYRLLKIRVSAVRFCPWPPINSPPPRCRSYPGRIGIRDDLTLLRMNGCRTVDPEHNPKLSDRGFSHASP
ncbi:MAG: hypothetical protein O7F71_15580, partial [Gammaproteobacteria bacterium]|nr:hypothetical protein [Gammaproteobacteria bacterium]